MRLSLTPRVASDGGRLFPAGRRPSTPPGQAVGTTGIVRTDARLVPRALVAVTVNECPMPAVSPGTVTCSVPAPTGTVPISVVPR